MNVRKLEELFVTREKSQYFCLTAFAKGSREPSRMYLFGEFCY